MSAEGALDDPAIFARAIAAADDERRTLLAKIKQAKGLHEEKRAGTRQLSDEEKAVVTGRKEDKARLAKLPTILPPPPLSAAVPLPPPPAHSGGANATASMPTPSHLPSAPLDLAEQYLALVRVHPPPGGHDAVVTHTVFHVRRLARALLTEYELMDTLKSCTSVDACARVVERCREYADGHVAFDPAAEAARRVAEESAARRAANAARRAEFVARMTARARAEGRAADWYMRSGREPPTEADLAKAKRMADPKALTKWWRGSFGQHCQGYYVGGACPHLADARGCGFLHGEEV